MPTTLRASTAPAQRPWYQRALAAAPTTRNAINAASDATNLRAQVRSARDAFVGRPRTVAEVRTQTAANWRAAARDAARGPSDVLDRRALAGRGVRTVRQVTSLVNLPQTAATAWRDVRQAVRTRSTADIATATGSSASLLNDSAQVSAHTPDLAPAGNRFAPSYRAARSAFLARAPAAPVGARRTAARVAADSLGTRTRQATRLRAISAARSAAPEAGERLLTVAATRAARAGRVAAVEVATGRLARVAGRFVPGVNVALAVADTATAYAALRDPQASVGRRVTSVVTALGSIAAATNIPVVSQVGAAVSTISSIAGAVFP